MNIHKQELAEETDVKSSLSLAELLSHGARIEAQSDANGLEVLVNNKVVPNVREFHVLTTTRKGVSPEIKLRCIVKREGVEEWQEYIVSGANVWITAQRHNPPIDG